VLGTTRCFQPHKQVLSFFRHYTMVRSWITALLLAAAVNDAAAVKPDLVMGKPRGLLGKRAPSPDVLTNNLVPLKTVTMPLSWQSSSHQRKTLNRRQLTGNSTSGGNTTISNPQQLAYVAEVTWGNQTFDMLLDTGSSDTWLLQEGFQCLSSNGSAVAVRNIQPCVSLGLRMLATLG
jgi:hypothetical protein